MIRVLCALLICASLWGTVTWSGPINLSDISKDSSTPVLGMSNSTGLAVAAWEISNGVDTYIQAALYNGTTWGSASTLSNTSYNSDKPAARINSLGHAIVIWRRFLTSTTCVIEASFYNGISWSAPTTISDTSTVDSPALAIHPTSDEAIALWRGTEGVGALETSFFDGMNWTTILGFNPSASPVYNSIAMNASGHAITAWISGDANRTICVSLYNGSWSSPMTPPPSGLNALQTDVSLDSTDTATVLWSTLTAIQGAVWNGTNWQLVQTLVNGGNFFIEPRTFFHPSNHNAGAVWRGSGGVQGSIFDTQWSTPLELTRQGMNPDAAFDTVDGNVGVVWCIPTQIQFAEYNATTTTTPVTLSSIGTSASSPHIAIDASGNAIALWCLSNGTHTLIQTAKGTSTP